jgi:hypothetical protein
LSLRSCPVFAALIVCGVRLRTPSPDFIPTWRPASSPASQTSLSFIGSSHASTAHCAAAINPKASM